MSTWIIQCNLINQAHYEQLWDSLTELDIPKEAILVIPFDDSPLNVKSRDPYLIPYGSTSLCKRAQIQGMKGLYFDDVNFKCSTWFKNRSDMVNRWGEVMTMADAADYMRKQDTNQSLFIRPNDDLKFFNGEVITPSQYHEWLDMVRFGGGTSEPLREILVAPARRILMEMRFFVVAGKVISGSIYRRDGRLHKESLDDNAIIMKQAQGFADGWLPSEVVCMDLAFLENHNTEVLEFNCFNAAGFYHHDVKAIAEAVTNHANGL